MSGTKWNGLRRSPLKRGKGIVWSKGRTIARSALPRSNKPINPRSAKRMKFMKEIRVPLVKARLNGKLCDRCHQATAVDVHEILPRSAGGSMTDDSNLADVCRACHDWITDHPKLAAVEGFRRFRWEKYDEGT